MKYFHIDDNYNVQIITEEELYEEFQNDKSINHNVSTDMEARNYGIWKAVNADPNYAAYGLPKYTPFDEDHPVNYHSESRERYSFMLDSMENNLDDMDSNYDAYDAYWVIEFHSHRSTRRIKVPWLAQYFEVMDTAINNLISADL